MNHKPYKIILFLLLLMACAGSTGAAAWVNESHGKLPLSFEANQGQSDRQVKFLVRGLGYGVFLTSTEAVLALSKPPADPTSRRVPGGEVAAQARDEVRTAETAMVRMELVGANKKPGIMGLEPLPGKSNYLIGKDPKRWHTAVPHYAKVKYREVYPGIDLLYYGNQSRLEYDFVVAPASDPGIIQLVFRGVDTLRIDPQGDLILHTAGGEITQQKPLIYQEVKGERRRVAGHYVLDDQRRVGFKVASYDTSRPLIIDPALVYSTFLGGGLDELDQSIALDSARNAYVVGSIYSESGFPTTSGAFDRVCGSDGFCDGGLTDITVTKLNAAGTGLVYSTYLGGSGNERPAGVAVDSAGNAYITGFTGSPDFPTTPGAYDEVCGTGECDGFTNHDFVTKLNAAGNGLSYSTFLGDFDEASAADDIAVDSSGNAYVVGNDTNNGAYMAGVTPAGNDLFFNLGLGAGVAGRAIALDSAQNSYATGVASGSVFVNRLAHVGNQTNFTLLGTGVGTGIAVDSGNNIYVTGHTSASDFPITAGALDRTCGTDGACNPGTFGTSSDAFVSKLNSTFTLSYSTYLGGSQSEFGEDIAVDSSRNAYLTGSTGSSDFPTTPGAFDRSGGAPQDVFVTRLNAAGTQLLYSTYLGGASQSDSATGIALDSARNAYVTGNTSSKGFPTTAGAYDRSCGTDGTCKGGGEVLPDTFITKFAGPGTLRFSAATYSVNEGAGSVTITVARSALNTGAVSVNYATGNGTALAPADYTARSGTLTFASGATTQTFTVPITNNTAAEPNETVNLTLSAATNGVFLGTPKTATLTIVDND